MRLDVNVGPVGQEGPVAGMPIALSTVLVIHEDETYVPSSPLGCEPEVIREVYADIRAAFILPLRNGIDFDSISQLMEDISHGCRAHDRLKTIREDVIKWAL